MATFCDRERTGEAGESPVTEQAGKDLARQALTRIQNESLPSRVPYDTVLVRFRAGEEVGELCDERLDAWRQPDRTIYNALQQHHKDLGRSDQLCPPVAS